MLLPRECNCYIASHVCQTEAAISINCGLQIKADLLMRHAVLDPRIATLIEPWQEYQAVQMRLQVKCSKLCPLCCFGLQASVCHLHELPSHKGDKACSFHAFVGHGAAPPRGSCH